MKSYDVDQAAEFLGMHPDTLKLRVRMGFVKAYKPARKLVFLETDLLEYLQKQQCQSTSAQAQIPIIADSKSTASMIRSGVTYKNIPMTSTPREAVLCMEER